MRFQVKGQEYFLAFVEDEGRWYVFAPTAQGVQRMPVYVDVPAYERSPFGDKVNKILSS